MNFIKNAVSKVLSQRVLAPVSSRFIFVYHDVSEPDSPQYSDLYSTDTKIFKAQIDFLKENFQLVSLDEILSIPPEKQKNRLAAITFDDGFLSVKETAMPYLVSLNIPFTIFLNSTAIEQNFLPYDQFDEINRKYDRRVYLNANEVRELAAAKGVTIGSHTANHRTIGNCDEKELREEIDANKAFLENLTGSEVAHLAIPYGKREHYNQSALDYCRKAGHKFIYCTNPVYFKESWTENDSRPIPRIGLTNQTPQELCFLINRPLIKKIDI
jgi:peptidoglycan/xylan/chitin deacetylase (PgdA/CDA1 family)